MALRVDFIPTKRTLLMGRQTPILMLPTEIIILIFDLLPSPHLIKIVNEFCCVLETTTFCLSRLLVYAALASFWNRDITFINDTQSPNKFIDGMINIRDRANYLVFVSMLSRKSALGCTSCPKNILFKLNCVQDKDRTALNKFLGLIANFLNYEEIIFKVLLENCEYEYDPSIRFYSQMPKLESICFANSSQLDQLEHCSSYTQVVEMRDCKSIRLVSSFPPCLREFTCISTHGILHHVVIDPMGFPPTIEALNLGAKVLLSNSGYQLPNLKTLVLINSYSETREFFMLQQAELIQELTLSRLPLVLDHLSRLHTLRTLVLIGYQFPDCRVVMPKRLEALSLIRCVSVNLSLLKFPTRLNKIAIIPKYERLSAGENDGDGDEEELGSFEVPLLSDEMIMNSNFEGEATEESPVESPEHLILDEVYIPEDEYASMGRYDPFAGEDDITGLALRAGSDIEEQGVTMNQNRRLHQLPLLSPAVWHNYFLGRRHNLYIGRGD